jgi:hypothetical protein
VGGGLWKNSDSVCFFQAPFFVCFLHAARRKLQSEEKGDDEL